MLRQFCVFLRNVLLNFFAHVFVNFQTEYHSLVEFSLDEISLILVNTSWVVNVWVLNNFINWHFVEIGLQLYIFPPINLVTVFPGACSVNTLILFLNLYILVHIGILYLWYLILFFINLDDWGYLSFLFLIIRRIILHLRLFGLDNFFQLDVVDRSSFGLFTFVVCS